MHSFNTMSRSDVAVFSLPEDFDGISEPTHDVTVYNRYTGTPVNIGILSDTGNQVTLLRDHWAEILGYPDYQTIGKPLDVEGVGSESGVYKKFFIVPAFMQIGSLPKFKTPIAFGPTPVDLLGRETAMKDYYVLYGPRNVAYIPIQTNTFENAVETAQAYARNNNSSFYSYETSMSRRGCACRNRI